MVSKKRFFAYYPGKKFPAVSITGSACQQSCAHCGGHYLESMVPTECPGELIDTCRSLHADGANGILISGGCDASGRIDLEPFFPAMEQVKKETGMKLNIHTGVLEPDEIRKLAEVGVDTVSFDIVGDRSVIKDVYHLDLSVGDFRISLEHLLKAGINVVPHICIGLSPGNINGEKKAVDLLRSYNIGRLIFIIFIPTKGTAMEHVLPPDESAVREVLSYARGVLPDTELVLGCMRPRRPKRYEKAAIEAGVTGIVLPTSATIKELEDGGWEIIRSEQCCSL